MRKRKNNREKKREERGGWGGLKGETEGVLLRNKEKESVLGKEGERERDKG